MRGKAGKFPTKAYKPRKLEMTEREKEIGRTLGSGGCRNYSARAAQLDLDIHTRKGEYLIDGDTYRGYFIRHRASDRVVVKNFCPRELVIATIDLWRNAPHLVDHMAATPLTELNRYFPG